MKIVIDIDEVIYKYIKKFDEIPTCGNIVYDACITGIHKGKSIPEHHGRLIDADKLLENACQVYDKVRHMWSPDFVLNAEYIDSAPTIIEADKGSDSE